MTAEVETPAEALERVQRLRTAKDDPRWDCPACGVKGAKWSHESHPEICKLQGRSRADV